MINELLDLYKTQPLGMIGATNLQENVTKEYQQYHSIKKRVKVFFLFFNCPIPTNSENN